MWFLSGLTSNDAVIVHMQVAAMGHIAPAKSIFCNIVGNLEQSSLSTNTN
jgi:hypothetical protein